MSDTIMIMDKGKMFKKIHAMARKIPPGSVSTYGQLARLAGLNRGARVVGWAMMSEPQGEPIPAHRVIHADGTLCTGSDWEPVQRQRLLEEGITFDARGRVDMAVYQMEDSALFALLDGIDR